MRKAISLLALQAFLLSSLSLAATTTHKKTSAKKKSSSPAISARKSPVAKSTARASASKRASSSRSTSTRTTAKTRQMASSRKGSSKRSTPRRPARQAQPTAERYREIQSALASKGYLRGEPTGQWDQSSLEALRRFQQDQNLQPSGKLDSLSLIALGLGPKRDNSVPATGANPNQQAAPTVP